MKEIKSTYDLAIDAWYNVCKKAHQFMTKMDKCILDYVINSLQGQVVK